LLLLVLTATIRKNGIYAIDTPQVTSTYRSFFQQLLNENMIDAVTSEKKLKKVILSIVHWKMQKSTNAVQQLPPYSIRQTTCNNLWLGSIELSSP
jgi:hypothetical protein